MLHLRFIGVKQKCYYNDDDQLAFADRALNPTKSDVRAVCFRKHLLGRGNHTNNYSEAGIRILKELIFSRVKAYNHVQMFSFITECMELYYCRKLMLSAAHNRLDRYISLKYQGLNCSKISYENIYEIDSKESIYLVNSKTERDVKYLVRS